ncbi:MAG: asparagine synthase-related protein [Pseudomonadota bacterium]
MTQLLGSLSASGHRLDLVGTQSVKCPKSGIVSVLEGSPYWEDRHLATLSSDEGHAAALAEGYGRRGADVLDLLGGSFVFAIHDPQEQACLLACDRTGIMPLYYAYGDAGLVFATRADTVANEPGVDARFDPQALFDFLYFHVVPGPETVYAGVKRLQPGECLRWSEGEVSIEPYWVMDYEKEVLDGSCEEWRKRSLELLSDAVRRHTEGKSTVGAFLSGGIDSSTISGLLSRLDAGSARTYSIGFDADGYDEMEYARIVARHFGAEHHEYYVTPDDVASAIPRLAAHFDQPFANASAVPTFYCAQMAKSDGVDRLLAGDGGDELFGGNYRYAKQELFALYDRVPAALRQYVLEPALLRSSLGNVGPFRKLANYISQANLPMPQRMESYNLLERLGPESVLTDAVMEQIDVNAPLQLLSETYEQARASSMLNRILTVDMRFTLADSDLPKVTRACEMAGVQVAFPFLDDRVVEFCSRLPTREKVRGRKLRYLFRDAVREFLPEQVLTKKKHGFGLPFGVWLREYPLLRELTHDSLNALKGRELIKPEFIDNLLEQHSTGHAAYYGTMVWTLLMLEQWLSVQEQSQRAA